MKAQTGLHLLIGQKLGKYRLGKKLGVGGYCEVWRARDTVEGIDVAIKIPLLGKNGQRDNQTILREVKLVSQLRHDNILPVKNADITDGYAIMATELGQKTLDDCSRPMSGRRIVHILSQVLSALAYAHRQRIVHCDVTPGNIFLFPEGRALLGDFGIGLYLKGRVVTVDEFGTPGYVAPEQAYGKPTYRSDCFSLGLILYEYLTGVLPRWPYRWPFKGCDRLGQKTNSATVKFLRKALMVSPDHRFANAGEMLTAFHEALPKKLLQENSVHVPDRKVKSWQHLRRDRFVSRYQRIFHQFFPCVDCGEPVAEVMGFCPWCGSGRNRFEERTTFECYCPSCHKGVSPEWPYCPWCYSPGFASSEPGSVEKRLSHQGSCKYCGGKLLRFMRYCPWCHRKVQKDWHVRPFPEVCGRCRWAVDTEFWSYCPWCRQNLNAQLHLPRRKTK